MSLGERIKEKREQLGLTQEEVAKQLEISFQAVSSWERDEYKPDTKNLIKLADILNTSVSSLVEDKISFKTKKEIYDWKHMKTYVKTTAKHYKLSNTLKALDYAMEAHKGQSRKKSDVPYIYHPLNMACHILALDIMDDEIIAATLLHDVIEDCGKSYEDLPVKDSIKKLVSDLTREEIPGASRKEKLTKYYKKIKSNPKACLIKCVDRCNNLTTMSWGLSRDRIYRTISETEEYVLPLLKVLKNIPEYNNAYWLLNYQIESMLDIYKRLL